MIHQAWLIPALPAIAFFLIVFVGKRTPGGGAPIGIAAVGVSFVMSLLVLFHFVHGGDPVGRSLFYLSAGFLRLDVEGPDGEQAE